MISNSTLEKIRENARIVIKFSVNSTHCPGTDLFTFQDEVLDLLMEVVKEIKFDGLKYEPYFAAFGCRVIPKVRVTCPGRKPVSASLINYDVIAKIIKSHVTNEFFACAAKQVYQNSAWDDRISAQIRSKVTNVLYYRYADQIRDELSALDLASLDQTKANLAAERNNKRAEKVAIRASLNRIKAELTAHDFSKEDLIQLWEEVQIEKVHGS